MKLPFPELTPDEAAQWIQNGQTLGFSGFASAGSSKVIPKAIAGRAHEEHNAGRPFKIGVITGASTGDALDGELARVNAISFRTPFQSHPDLRKRINSGDTDFFDLHLSQLPLFVRWGFLGPVNWAIIQASAINPDGEIVLTNSVGAAPTFCESAHKIIIELNEYHPHSLKGIHDIYQPNDPPHRREIPLYSCSDRIGKETVKIDPKKIVGVVKTELPDDLPPLKPVDGITKQIGLNVADFLAKELKRGHIPKEFFPMQFGIGNLANAVLAAMAEHPEIPNFPMYSEVIQDSAIQLIASGKVNFASATSIAVSPHILDDIYKDLEFFKKRIVLRPQEISNSPEVIRRLGVIAVNTALEVDLLGNVNSTHVMGSDIMNGIGGSGDFARHAYTSIFTCPSLAKGGKISPIVPQVTYTDHDSHSAQIIITDKGVADLRCKPPYERAKEIIDNCVHEDFRDTLHDFLHVMKRRHTPQSLWAAYAMHEHYLKTGDMRGVQWQAAL